VPFVEKLLHKALKNCLDLGMSVPAEISPAWGIQRFAKTCQIRASGSFILGSRKTPSKVGQAQSPPSILFPLHTYTGVWCVCDLFPFYTRLAKP
jgi:hypothetical protein